tara:strand:- start:1391 stop:2491 length:1101 start_codon:yes stop_codon:yes gene_type:complete
MFKEEILRYTLKIMNTDIFIQSNKSLSVAIKTINKTGSRCLLVISEGNVLVGALSDGDIRRAILKGYSLDDSILDFYNKDPFFFNEDSLDDLDIYEIFLDKKYDLIPLVDKKMCIKEIYYFEDVFKGDIPSANVRDDTMVVIMAGGIGSRLLPITQDMPKPMIKIDNRPIIQIVIENFYRHGIRDFLISVNHMSEQITSFLGDGSRFDVNIQYIHEDKPLGTCGSLSLIENLEKNKNYIITNADILADLDVADLLKEHKVNGADISVCTKLHEVNIPYGVVRGKKFLEGIDEKPNKTFWINSGIYVFNTNILNSLEYNIRKDMPDFIQEKIVENKSIAIYPMTGYWKDIGDKNELIEARDRYKIKH